MSKQIPSIKRLDNKASEDGRGKFIKFFDSSLLPSDSFQMQQTNYVHTKEKMTLRGLHFQTQEFAEAKIFRVLKGAIQLGFFDTTATHPNEQSSGFVLLDQIDQAYYIPRGFATGYLTLSDDTTVLYMSDNVYAPAYENGIRPNDPCLNIDWRTEDYQTSLKDQSWPDWV